MITDSELDRLLAVRTQHRSILSLYLWVPSDPAELRELPAMAHDLLALAANDGDGKAGADVGPVGSGPPGSGPVGSGPVGSGSPGTGSADAAGLSDVPGTAEQHARTILTEHAREWLGHTAAIFVAEESVRSRAPGGPETFSLPCRLPDRAVLATRPHVRPLLVARQRCPAHYVAIVDRQHAWLFRVTGDDIEAATAAHADQSGEIREVREQHAVRSQGFGGWYGLESYRINDRILELTHEHFRAVIERIERAVAARTGVAEPTGFADLEPLVVGGHEETIGQFVEMLPQWLRARLAGTFVVDTHTMTPARVREHAKGIIADWVGMHEQRRTVELREAEGQHDPLTVTGLNRCLDAINQRAVDLLVVPVGGVIDGYVCERCGQLAATVPDCPDGPEQSRWVPDLFEEMVIKTIAEGGRTEALTDPPGDVAAHLRFPVLQSSGR